MKRVHILIMTFVFIFAIAPVTFASTTSTNSVQIFRTGWEPIELTGLNNCNGELFSLTGVVQSQLVLVEDGSGGFHLQNSIRIRGTAVGLVTGAKYIDAGEGGTFIEHLSAFNGTYVSNFQSGGVIISLDREVPDLRYTADGHLTLDANGNLKSSFDNFKISC
ncbi:hypothetical protein [Nitrosomonas sp. Nm166]|uniref:hypothetical protein n=1 Tax=Nitrosomonas sp. Nm166 TaxID=1881054 RepID=UPI0008F14DCD|nr:hypothetical protein [Nitrosomonas sp. Nm166]SFF12267.1 hypothetical protein SAMN05428977_10531 [Nitrosomonas sp. Nm166]